MKSCRVFLLAAGEESAATDTVDVPVAASAPLLAPAAGAAKREEKPRTVTGRVNDPQGPADGGRPRPGRGGEADGSGTLVAAVTDREGTFILEGLRRERVPIGLSRLPYQLQSEAIPADKDEIALDLPTPNQRGGPAQPSRRSRTSRCPRTCAGG